MRLLIFLSLLIFTCCSEPKNRETADGFTVLNESVHAGTFNDTRLAGLSFRSLTSHFRNDSKVPATLAFDVPDDYYALDDTGRKRFRLVMLPDSIADAWRFRENCDADVSPALERLVQNDTVLRTMVTRVIPAGSSCAVHFGMIFDQHAGSGKVEAASVLRTDCGARIQRAEGTAVPSSCVELDVTLHQEGNTMLRSSVVVGWIFQ